MSATAFGLAGLSSAIPSFNAQFRFTGAGTASLIVENTPYVALVCVVSGILFAWFDYKSLPHLQGRPVRLNRRADKTIQVIYDGVHDFYSTDFKGVEGYIWRGKGDKVERISNQGRGTLDVDNYGMLDIQRTNIEGRFEIWLLRYLYNGNEEEYIPENVAISGRRKIHISCQAKVSEGQHILQFILKNDETQDWLADAKKRITKTTWTDIELLFRVNPLLNCRLRIDDQEPAKAPSSIQIRNLVVEELS
jgi:hypothetical protein